MNHLRDQLEDIIVDSYSSDNRKDCPHWDADEFALNAQVEIVLREVDDAGGDDTPLPEPQESVVEIPVVL